MSLAVVASQALCGLDGFPVRVEVHIGPGLPGFAVVGLPDAGVRESRERVRSAIVSSGFDFPAGRITVNLAPADLPKESGRFDLPIAVGLLLASGQIVVAPSGSETLRMPDVSAYVFAGELSLTGAVVRVDAPLAIALAVARSRPQACLVLPPTCARDAARLSGLRVMSAATLSDIVAHFSGVQDLSVAQPSNCASPERSFPCLGDVRGQASARRALEIAAAGAHSMLMAGSPGIGKSMLAQRLPGLLPALNRDQAIEVAAMASVCGLDAQFSMVPPFRAPHHSASVAALVGGGASPRPGEISLAHHGVLFLDELPEFDRRVLESLREPMETGVVSIARAARTLTFPAEFQFLAAMNPCPCGYLGHPSIACTCSPERVDRYRAKLSGPLLDRIDLQITLPPPAHDWMDAPREEDSATVRRRVQQARQVQLSRAGHPNAKLSASEIGSLCVLPRDGKQLIHKAMQRWNWSARTVDRVLRVARTIADLASEPNIQLEHLTEASQYRQPWGAPMAPGHYSGAGQSVPY